MKITLIGHFCIDIFHHSDGRVEKRLGGIYHAVAALANIALQNDILFPVFGVGVKEMDEVRAALGKFKNVNLAGIFQLDTDSNIVHYFDDSPNECVQNISPPISFTSLEPFLAADGIYINMISGRDITLETLDRIRLAVREKRIPIHLDVHCLALGINPDGTRFSRAVSDWRRWCFMTDSVQMNEKEARAIAMEHYSDEVLAKQMIPLMVKAFVVTRGKNGATLFREDHKTLKRNDFNEGGNENPVSVIGSGDIFGASFLYRYVQTKNYTEAASFAQKVSAFSTQFSLSEKHNKLQKMREVVSVEQL